MNAKFTKKYLLVRIWEIPGVTLKSSLFSLDGENKVTIRLYLNTELSSHMKLLVKDTRLFLVGQKKFIFINQTIFLKLNNSLFLRVTFFF